MEIVFARILHIPIATTRLFAPGELLASSLTIIAVLGGVAPLDSAAAVRSRTVLSRISDVVTLIAATAFAARCCSDLVVLSLSAVGAKFSRHCCKSTGTISEYGTLGA